MGRAKQNEIIEDLDRHLSRIELIGNHRITIENHKGLQEYSDISMRIALSDGILHIIGQGMEIYGLTLTELTVTGKINSIEYIQTEKRR